MSSLRNAVKRIAHKERSQPKDRERKFGLLEKKKDYRQRSQNYHAKQERLLQMKRRASARNPDEFYFGMTRAQVNRKTGRHQQTLQAEQEARRHEIGPEAVRIMKDQDLSHVRLLKQRDMAKVERLQASLHFLGDDNDDYHDTDDTRSNQQPSNKTTNKRKRKHTVFVDSQSEADTFNVAAHFDTVPELAGRAFNRPRLDCLKQEAALEEGQNNRGDYETTSISLPAASRLETNDKKTRKMMKRIAKARATAYKELEGRTQRIATLSKAQAMLETEKLVAGKGRKRKIRAAASDGSTPAVYKWRRKRLG